jgi:tRNA threonylcarbamoyladenosine biosynthesis protein TsaE
MGGTSCSLTTASSDESRELGRVLGAELGAGSLVALTGDLGSGKTVLVQGLARGLGFDGYVSSPTFVIVNEYAGRIPIYHVDLYRIGDERSLVEIGYRELFFTDGASLVEWADRVPELLPAYRLDVRIEIQGPNDRRFVLTPRGDGYESLLRSFVGRWPGRVADADTDD